MASLVRPGAINTNVATTRSFIWITTRVQLNDQG